MKLYEVWVAKFEEDENFGKISHLYIDEKTDFDILAVKDERRKCVIDIDTMQEYRYFDRDSKNRILPSENNIQPNVYYALSLEEADLSKKGTLEKLSIIFKGKCAEKHVKQKQIKR